MATRIKSLKQLGKGAWKVSASTPVNTKSPAKQALKAAVSHSSPPHEILWSRVQKVWGNKARYEYEHAIPNRKFRLDIAFPDIKLCVEVDGWQYHGKHKAGFHKDREKQMLLTENGWLMLRFSTKAIFNDVESCLASIQRTINISGNRFGNHAEQNA